MRVQIFLLVSVHYNRGKRRQVVATRLTAHYMYYCYFSSHLTAPRRHKASKPQGSSKRVLPWQVTMDQLLCASLSHTHYRYEVDMLKVPALNAIGIQLRDPINSGLSRYQMTYGGLNKEMDAAAELGRNPPVSKHQIRPEYGDEHADAGRDCRTSLARQNSQAQTGTTRGKLIFPVQLTSRAGLATLPG